MDQATSLRDEFREHDMDVSVSPGSGGTVYLITSGKGGVGKSILSVNLAYALGSPDHPVLLIDADSHGSHLELMIGSNPSKNLDDVVSGNESILNVIDRSYTGVHLIAGADGIPLNRNFDIEMRRIVCDNMTRLKSEYPYIIIDGGSSELENLELFSKISTSVILVSTPELTSITDTYALAKYLILKLDKDLNIQIIINKSQAEVDSREIASRLNLMTENFLQYKLSYAGSVSALKDFRESVENQNPAILNDKSGVINKIFTQLLENLQKNRKENIVELNLIEAISG